MQQHLQMQGQAVPMQDGSKLEQHETEDSLKQGMAGSSVKKESGSNPYFVSQPFVQVYPAGLHAQTEFIGVHRVVQRHPFMIDGHQP